MQTMYTSEMYVIHIWCIYGVCIIYMSTYFSVTHRCLY